MDILVRNASELRDAFSNANGGDTIKLAPGDYGETLLRGEDFSTDVTITSADPTNRAVFDETLELKDVSGVTIKGVDVEAGSLAQSASVSRFMILDSQDVTVRDVKVEGHIPTVGEGKSPANAGRMDAIQGFGHENGMRIRRSDDVTLDNVEFRDLRQSVALSDTTGMKMSRLNVYDVREGINMADVEDILIEKSWFHDFQIFGGDHTDMIQYWGTNTGVHGLTIRDNLLHQPEGSFTQSIFGHFNNRPDYVTGSDFTITGNTIINAHSIGIRIREIDGFEISDNVLLPNEVGLANKWLPQITVIESQNGEISDNFLIPRWNGDFVNNEDGQSRNNTEVSGNVALSRDSDSDLHWVNLLDGARPDVPTSPDNGEAEAPAPAPEPTEPEPTEPETEAPAPEPTVPEPTEPEPTEPEEEKDPVAEAPGLPSDTIVGSDAYDQLRDTRGDTALTGLGGPDRFYFDYRADTGPSRDVITDFSFAEGDRLAFIGRESGTFDDSVDPSNRMTINYDGARAHIRSEADLVEAAGGNGLFLEAGDGGDSLIITLAEAPDRSIELLNFAADEFIL